MSLTLDLMRALADPTRLRIIALLRAMELSVGELAQVLGQSQPRVSRHVKILCDAGLAARRKEGSWVFLTLGDPARTTPLFSAFDAWAALSGSALAGGDHWAIADAAKLAAVRADRARAAEQWFTAHAQDWDAIRSLHIAETIVEDALQSAIAGHNIGRMVDIGTGTGRMIELFGEAAERATGIDRSSEMLRLARAKLDGRTVELRQGDVTALPLPDASADTIIIHQVLHYLPAPEAAIAEAGRIAASGARILIVDFDAHHHEELRASHAHARLGFSDGQVLGWLSAAGFAGECAATLSGSELTVKIWRGDKLPAAPSAHLKMVS
jgi:ArsR family transcriptional regulator